MSDLKLELNERESRDFFFSLDSELRKLVNEYDDDTGRIPGKRRLATLPVLSEVVSKWTATQPTIGNSNFVNLDAIVGATIVLSDEERTISKRILSDDAKGRRRYLEKTNPPYEGFLAEIFEDAGILEELAGRM